MTFAGRDGFIWWFGVVESRLDPLNIGRVQVRIQGHHTDDKSLLPTKDLPWASIVIPTTDTTVKPPKEGDFVFGFFADTESAQHPVVLGVVPGIVTQSLSTNVGFSDPRTGSELSSAPRPPASKEYKTDGSGIVVNEQGASPRYPNSSGGSNQISQLEEPTTSRLARNEHIDKTFIQERKDNKVTGVPDATDGTWDEPETKYNAKYPYNKVYESESGNILEIDDTPGAERIHIAHRSGSFVELYPDGTTVIKSTKSRYQIVMADEKIYIMGDSDITVQGNAGLYIKGNHTMKVDGNVEWDIKGDWNATIQGQVDHEVTGTYTRHSPDIEDDP